MGVKHNGSMAVTVPSYFSPHALAVGARSRGCLTCENFHGEFYAKHLVCNQRDKPQVIGRPDLGCAFWVRATGADDCRKRKPATRAGLYRLATACGGAR